MNPQKAITVSDNNQLALNEHLAKGYTVQSCTPFDVATGCEIRTVGLILVILNPPPPLAEAQ